MRCDRIWANARLATLSPDRPGLGEVTNGLIASQDGQIVYAGDAADAPRFEAAETIDCQGRWITPGLIDPHTHLIFGGDRAHEFELRLAGASYEDIAASDAAKGMVQGYIDELNAGLNRWEQIKKFTILGSDLSIENGELTPSLKVKRKVVTDRYKKELDAHYA